MTRSEMRVLVFKLIFRVPFHDKNELREQIDYYFDGLTDVNEKDYEYIKNKALLVCELSDDIECGYILTDGGNFDGVCHGLDQAVSLILKIKREKI